MQETLHTHKNRVSWNLDQIYDISPVIMVKGARIMMDVPYENRLRKFAKFLKPFFPLQIGFPLWPCGVANRYHESVPLGSHRSAKRPLNLMSDGLRVRQEDLKWMERRKLHIRKKTRCISFAMSGWEKEKHQNTNYFIIRHLYGSSLAPNSHRQPSPLYAFIMSD